MGATGETDGLETFYAEALAAIGKAATSEELERLRVLYAGRKSELARIMGTLASMTPEEKRTFGARANRIKADIESTLTARAAALAQTQATAGPAIDITLPATPEAPGHRHPLDIVAAKALEVFKKLGFKYLEGPEIESDERNFTALNIEPAHPARDMHDTLYIKDQPNLLLRTHTTPLQTYLMRAVEPPYRVVTYGKVFRCEAVDATHLPVFHQIDAFFVDHKASMADLKSTLETWAAELFGAKTKIRFRPSYFPFTEPSCEVEVACFLCHGQGCPTCKRSGWIELLGAGLIHPNVLEHNGQDPKKWKGFAFGMGVERVAMTLWGIPDIRLFYENDLDFLEQFNA
ncbi:MAG: phenylalanine--tRNA ligase subunit alpha [Elusimicrobiota bacterium]